MLAKNVGSVMPVMLFVANIYGPMGRQYIVIIKNQLRGCVDFKNLCNLAGADRNA
jgi:hypothetical protein